jgi:hypothetical protein
MWLMSILGSLVSPWMLSAKVYPDYFLNEPCLMNFLCNGVGAFSYEFGALDDASNDFVEAYRNVL